MQRKGESFFSYPLTRPYPFAWFTYVAIIAGVILTVLFSFVALATDGYDLDLVYTLDLNDTLHQDYWFQKAPFSWFSRDHLSCQPALLTPGNTYFTSNLGFMYSMDKLWQGNSVGMSKQVLPAASYENTELQDCQVRQIEIDFTRRDQTPLPENFWSWELTTSSGVVTCTLETPSGNVKANLSVELPQVQYSTRLASLMVSTNITEHANIWFGSQFLYSWYKQLSIALGFSTDPDGLAWSSGKVILYPNIARSYTDLDFFFAEAHFFNNQGWQAWMGPENTIADWANTSSKADRGLLPNITTTVSVFGKVFYSLMLADLGMADGQTNALLTADGIMYLQSRIDMTVHDLAIDAGKDEYTGQPSGLENAFDKDGPGYPIDDAYQSVVDALGHPPDLNTTTTSTIFAQYLCSIPKRKGGGALFFSVLLADLVFLQAAWTLLNLAATWWLERKDPTAHLCEGCLALGASTVPSKEVSNTRGVGHAPVGRSSSIELEQCQESKNSTQRSTW